MTIRRRRKCLIVATSFDSAKMFSNCRWGGCLPVGRYGTIGSCRVEFIIETFNQTPEDRLRHFLGCNIAKICFVFFESNRARERKAAG